MPLTQLALLCIFQVSPIKGKYDYAVIIALLTFGLLTASEWVFFLAKFDILKTGDRDTGMY